MCYTIERGLPNYSLVSKLFELDALYFEDAYDFNTKLAYGLLDKSPDTILILKENTDIIGYLHYIHLNDIEYARLLSLDYLTDVDIDLENVLLSSESSYIYFMVIVLHPNYIGKGLSKLLIEHYNSYIASCPIKGELAYGVTQKGTNLFNNLGFDLVKKCSNGTIHTRHRGGK